MINEKELEFHLSKVFDNVEVRKESIPGMRVIKVKFVGLDGSECSLRFVCMGGKLRLWRVSHGEEKEKVVRIW